MTKACFKCGKCCIETEMILSQEDVKKILKKTKGIINHEDFCFINEEGFLQLRNKNNHCFFFDVSMNKCKIYKIRPQGCKFYPLIYDMTKNQCVIDLDCPEPFLFYADKEVMEKTCFKIKFFLTNKLKIKL